MIFNSYSSSFLLLFHILLISIIEFLVIPNNCLFLNSIISHKFSSLGIFMIFGVLNFDLMLNIYNFLLQHKISPHSIYFIFLIMLISFSSSEFSKLNNDM